MKQAAESSPLGSGWTRESSRQRQLREGLALSPAERLEWLEQTIQEWSHLLGAARRAAAAKPEGPASNATHVVEPRTGSA
jgi:hypothetical protein